MGSRDRLSEAEICEAQIGRDDVAASPRPCSARLNAENVVPSYISTNSKPFRILERETGVEPATSSLGSWHSTTELLPPSYAFRYFTESSIHYALHQSRCNAVEPACPLTHDTINISQQRPFGTPASFPIDEPEKRGRSARPKK
jgi:hypothetical protein